MMATIPIVSNNTPSSDFLVNFSLNNKNDSPIDSKIDNIPMEVTTTGLAYSFPNASSTHNQAPLVARAERVRKIQVLGGVCLMF